MIPTSRPSEPTPGPRPRDPATLAEADRAWRAEHPQARVRDIAEGLGVSEAELLDARGPAQGCTRLDPAGIRPVLRGLGGLGRVMVLTRNASVVHEKTGVYEDIHVGDGPVALCVGADLDLRFFMAHWHHLFLVEGAGRDGELSSVQFFDAAGDAVHKVYPRTPEGVAALRALVAPWRPAAPLPPLQVVRRTPDDAYDSTVPGPEAEGVSRDEAGVDVAAFRADWSALRDTHDFIKLLRVHGVDRRRALRLAGAEFARPVDPQLLTGALNAAAAGAVPIMVFAGNHGCLQIHSGPVRRVRPLGPWINVLDGDFDLHVRQDRLVEAWWVRKPTADGDVHALECFDDTGILAIQLFGVRKPGVPERADWRQLLAELGAGPAPT